jgi:hypothetical protein
VASSRAVESLNSSLQYNLLAKAAVGYHPFFLPRGPSTEAREGSTSRARRVRSHSGLSGQWLLRVQDPWYLKLPFQFSDRTIPGRLGVQVCLLATWSAADFGSGQRTAYLAVVVSGSI